MPKIEEGDILIKLNKKWYLDGVSWVIWYDNFEATYPNIDSFFDGLKENVAKRLKEIGYHTSNQTITGEEDV